MKHFKKIVALTMTLGTLSTSGIIANADTTDDSKQLYICGDTNLDGKLNTIDILLSKRVILHLAEPKYMYADGDTIKMYENIQGQEVTIQATEYTVDVENNTIHVTGIGDTTQMHDLTLKVTDDTTFSGNFSNLEEVAKKLEDIKGLCIDITYNSLTNMISHVAQISVFPSTVETIQTYEYTIDVENNLINVKMSTDEYLPIKVTEDTVFDSYIINLEGLSKLELEGDMYGKAISITYHNNTLEAIEVNRILDIVEPIPFTSISSRDDYDINIDAENMEVSITGTGDNSGFSTILNIMDYTEITRNDETLTLEELSQITDYQYILIEVECNLDNNQVAKISLMDIN
ncbi:MAG: hypothetical protein ACI4WH_02110 [Oscillospiraceae bacterium]